MLMSSQIKMFMSTWSCSECQRREEEARYTSNLIHISKGILQSTLESHMKFYYFQPPTLVLSVTTKSILS